MKWDFMTMATRMTGTAVSKVTRRKQYAAPALEKGLDILEMLAIEPEPLNLKEIADGVGRSVGEIFRMLAVLEQRGYVGTGEGSERYQLTMKLFRLAHWHLPINRLTSAASAPMRRLAMQTGQSCHLSIMSGSRTFVVARQDSYKDRSFVLRIGAESPLLSSCSGLIFFTLADSVTRETLLERIREEEVDTVEVVETDDIARSLIEQSYIELPSQQVDGIIDIGTPITDHDGSVAAALVIPFLHRIDKNNESELGAVRKCLVQAAIEISSALGYQSLA
jgi:DNA-binding IclR family transcriptional regulator